MFMDLRKRFSRSKPAPNPLIPDMSPIDEILGINMRNALIAKYNPRIAIERARDKVAAKRALEAAGISCTDTIAVIDDYQKLAAFKPERDMPDAWAIKPARGSQGDGILLAFSKKGAHWVKASGTLLSSQDVIHHIGQILDGQYSGEGSSQDEALIEPLIIADPGLANLVPEGLPDLRVICLQNEPLLGMVRLPTNESDGKANLHQRAIGAGVSLETGEITRALQGGEMISHHPDTGSQLVGFVIPHWDRVLEMASKCGPAVGLGYSGADIVLDVNKGPLVLEVNAHPGLEIQNINQLGLKAQMKLAGEDFR